MGRRKFTLQTQITISAAAFTAASGTIHGTDKLLGNQGIKRMVMVMDVTSHDNSDANETYQVYITTGFTMPDGTVARWDVGAYTIVSGADAAVTQVMFVGEGIQQPTSNIADGTVTKMTSILSVITTNLRGTLTAAFARHGYFGDFLSYTIVGGGTTPGPIKFEIAGMVWDS
jgi:hypothetical protein